MKRIILFISILSAIAFLGTPQSLAATFQSGEVVTVSNANQDDAYIAAGEILIEGLTAGDVYVVGGQIEIKNDIQGDLVAAAGKIKVNGNVYDDVRVVGGEIEINQTVQDDLIVTGGRVVIGPKAQIKGDVIVTAGDVYISGAVDGEVRGWVGSITIAGTVEKQVTIMADEKITILPDASIGGNFIYSAWGEEVIPKENVKGEIIYSKIGTGSETRRNSIGQQIQSNIFFILGFVLLGFVLLKSVPAYINKVVGNIKERFFFNFLTGIGWIVLLPIASVLLLISGIGFPLTVVLVSLYIISLVIAWIVAAKWVGSWITRQTEGFWGQLGQVMVGMITLSIVMLIPSWIGAIAVFTVLVLALGSMILSLFVSHDA